MDSINGERNGGFASTFDYPSYPSRIAETPLLECDNRFVYMLMSMKLSLFLYIGETECIRTRLSQHNSGNGSSMTTPLHLRTCAVIAYICGFDGNNVLGRSIEIQWQ